MKYESINDQGVALLNKNQFNEALIFFEKALELKPDFVDALNNLGLAQHKLCLLYTSPSPRDGLLSRMPSSA